MVQTLSSDHLDTLREQGYCIVSDFLDAQMCKKLRDEIDNGLEKYTVQTQILFKEGMGGDRRLFRFENISETAKNFATQPDIRNLASTYMRNAQTCHFVLAGKLAFNPERVTNSGGGWHQDSTRRQFKSIVYLSDVEEQNGPFQIIEGDRQAYKSLKRRGFLKKSRFPQEEVQALLSKGQHRIRSVVAPAGTLILVDTSYIHTGKQIEQGERYSPTSYFFKGLYQLID